MSAVHDLQSLMADLQQAVLQTEHYFTDGMYCRKLVCPSGSLIVGKEHKRGHLFMVTKGALQVGPWVYGPGDVIVSEPGAKRAILALEDSVCLTVHRTNKKNLDKIEKELIEPDDTALFDARNKLKPKELT